MRIDKCILNWLCLTLASAANAATYYVNPATGNMSNNGTSSSTPWSTLEAVFTAGKTFAPGDVILLYTGFHGSPSVAGHIGGAGVTIQPSSGQSPGLKNVIFSNASGWTMDGLSISPMHVSSTTWSNTNLVDILSTSHHITVRNCDIYQVNNTTGWAVQAVYPNTANRAEFDARMSGRGVKCGGANCTIEDNHIRKTGFAIEVLTSGDYAVVRNNLIEDTVTDGIRVCADNIIVEDNTLRNWYGVHHDDDHHDDAIQGFASGGTIANLVVRRNLIINTTTATSSWPGTTATYRMHGMLFFDTVYTNARIENNVVMVDNRGHGITMGRGENCVIVNNTVVWNPIKRGELPGDSIPQIEPQGSYPMTGPWKDPTAEPAVQPWVSYLQYPDGTNGSGNRLRNNISGKIAPAGIGVPTSGVTTSNSLLITSTYTSHFVDYNAQNLRLIAASSAVGAGTTTDAPTADFDGTPRSSPYDIGAFEYAVSLNAPFALTATKQGYNQINLTWTDAASNESGFLIERKTGSSGVFAQIASVGAVGGTGGTATYSDTTAGSGTNYYYRVRAYNDSGNSGYTSQQNATTDEITSGRVGHWKMEEGSGTTTADASGSGSTGNLGASPANPGWVAGKIGNALNFDGADDVVNAGSGSSLDNLAAFTLAAWIRPDTLGEGSKGRILVKGAGLNPTAGWHLHVSGTNQLEFRVDYATTDLARLSGTNAITVGAWRHVLLTWNGSATATNVRMYVDGSEVSYSTATNGAGARADDSASSLYIGNENGGTRTFDGLMDDVRVYNRVLSPAEITAIYRAGL